ncbi:putative hydroxyacid dehydrogenase KNAG_0G01290 [Huiozyma naganishii CBS 8797]|uniref:D-isomer specific 2-hydroxyacid dehydrogenase NAD-binding domain-containing protein n=1 Tax=Huiozyma naganishii (strain ATCC MYA-139 / BCRC 22969 / CBS 8797 / KCTC 17520 / NBRC 10181 / NCYC 3082 / Yp74L-3) TaxID=1071383 RepID=J7S0W0_HUIN7|nr:hypothetical protein KNAG_0G01290 [Kazachstania naganishii CBS 8797]CCK71187.1 hypothetical protein KNAG_0G01290 [Kazachstania naganishii CBS 8797]
MVKTQSILFVQDPNEESELLSSDIVKENYNLLRHKLTSKDAFLKFMEEHRKQNITAIYGGFPAFRSIGGLTRDIIEHAAFYSTVRCVALCSRGVDGVDQEALLERGIQLFNYQDSEPDAMVSGAKQDLVGNEVADCALWHVLEGFRKFSLLMTQMRATKDTILGRAVVAGIPRDQMRFAFGHELLKGKYVESPRGKKCLILGLGNIGKQIGVKLQYGLGMEVHYAKRTEDSEVKDTYGWQFHGMDSLLQVLPQFHAIVVALPGSPETDGLINGEFLSHCKSGELILVNIGRAAILDMDAVTSAIDNGTIRHFGTDVYSAEPAVDALVLQDEYNTTGTPHVGSGTVEVFAQACETALANIIRTTLPA